MSQVRTLRNAQTTLAALFVGGLVLNVFAAIAAFSRGVIYDDNVPGLIGHILMAYSGPLGIIFGAYFAERKRDLPLMHATGFAMALVVSTMWNALLLWRSAVFAFAAEDSVERFSAYLADVSTGSMFLVAGALTFFFVRR